MFRALAAAATVLTVITVYVAAILGAGPRSRQVSTVDTRTTTTFEKIEAYRDSESSAQTTDISVVISPFVAKAAPAGNSHVDAVLKSVLSSGLQQDWEIIDLQVKEMQSGSVSSKRMVTIYVHPADCEQFYEGEARFIVADMIPEKSYQLQYRLSPKHGRASLNRALDVLRVARDGAFRFSAEFEKARLPSDAYFVEPVTSASR